MRCRYTKGNHPGKRVIPFMSLSEDKTASVIYTFSAISYRRRSESDQPRQGSVMDFP